MLAQQEQLQATSGNHQNLFFMRLEASEISIKCQKCVEPFPTDDFSKKGNQPTKLLLYKVGKVPFKDLQRYAEVWDAG